MSIKYDYEYIKSNFEEENYKLLIKEYKNNTQKLDYICPNGHEHFISWRNWNQGKRCPYCVGLGKPSVGFIKKQFGKEGYVLLTNEYKNNRQKLKYICPNGHEHSITWAHWSSGKRCPYCAGNVKLTIDFVEKKLKEEGYKLLTRVYQNSLQKLECICPNGHMYKVSWSNWQQGRRCAKCYFNYMSKERTGDLRYGKPGKLHHNWKGGISCEPYCDAWADKEYKESIKERDGYRCLNPDCWGNCNHLSLTIHHIDYDKKNCHPSNLITLCRSCNSRANKDRKWHKAWYQVIIYKRYKYY